VTGGEYSHLKYKTREKYSSIYFTKTLKNNYLLLFLKIFFCDNQANLYFLSAGLAGTFVPSG
jgi:hypothetical protein